MPSPPAAASSSASVLPAKAPQPPKQCAAILSLAEQRRREEDFVRVISKKPIGAGHYGIVSLGVLRHSGQRVAVKRIKKAAYTDKTALQAEVAILREVKHPNIIRLLDAFETRETLTLVTELAPGGELFDRIVAKKHLSEQEAFSVMRPLLQCLVYLHGRGIVHRDLKPENVLRTRQGSHYAVRVIDFGLAAHLPTGGEDLASRVGTPYYIAPEVLQRKYREKADMWSVGVMLYIMICGYPPFWGSTDARIFQRIASMQYSMQGKEWLHVSAPCKSLVRSLLTTPGRRLTALEALHHPWMLQEGCSRGSTGPGRLLLRAAAFYAQHPLKRAVLLGMARTWRSMPHSCVAEARQALLSCTGSAQGCIDLRDMHRLMHRAGATSPDQRAPTVFNACVAGNHEQRLGLQEVTAVLLPASVYTSTAFLVAAFDMVGGGRCACISHAALQRWVDQPEAGETLRSYGDANCLSMAGFCRIMCGNAELALEPWT